MSDPDHIYYDLDIVNAEPTDIQLRNYPLSNKLNFTEVRSSPILLNPSEYYLSIVRFSLDTANSLPAFIPQVFLDQPFASPNFPNETIYFITIGVPDPALLAPTFFVKQRVIYTSEYNPAFPSNSGIPQAPQQVPITLEEATSPYYWVSNFKNFIAMINTAILDAWTAIIAGSPYALPADAIIENCPFLIWDTDTQLASIYAPTSFLMGDSVDSDGAKLQLWMNTSLYTLFSSFESIFNGSLIDTTDVQENQTNYRLRIYGDHNRNIEEPVGTYPYVFPPFIVAPVVPPPVPTPIPAVRMVQSFQTGATMCPVVQVIFNTSLIPCANTLVGIPRITNGSGQLGSQQQLQNDNFSNQITDLCVNISNGYEYLPAILYEPTAQYRYIDLQGNTPLSGVQISVSWKDVYGIVHDFYLSNNQGTNMKILFQKKNTV